MKSRLPVLLGAVAVLLAGCATAPESSQVTASLPTLAQDRGRIYFYRSSNLRTAVLPPVKLNGQVVGIAKPHCCFFVDRPPGRYIVEVADAASNCALTLEKGQKCYVRVDFPSKGTGEILGEVALTPVVTPLALGLFGGLLLPGGPAGPISPTPVPSATGEREILKCSDTGPYWSSLGYGGEIREAAANGDLEKVKALLKGNPDLVLLKDTYGWTPLFYAISSGYLDEAEWLLEQGADVNATTPDGQTLLSWSVDYDRKDAAELLLAHKADVNVRNNMGQTPLQCAVKSGHEDVAKLLRQHGAE